MDSFTDLWKLIIPSVIDEIGETPYDVWIKPIVPVELTSDEAVIKVASDFCRKVISGRYSQSIKNAILNITGLDVDIKIITNDESGVSEIKEAKEEEDDSFDYTFDSFVVGSTNRFAHAAAQAVSNNPGKAYNPLFIYGPSGMGKTHLLFAIRDKILKDHPDMNIVYIKGDEFTNDLIEALGRDRHELSDFRKKYRYADVFLMDDIHFIAGKEQTQEEFFNTFNSLHQENKQIVLTSDRPPRDIKTLEERLRTRFESGLLADIQPPEFETRIAIVKRKAAQYNMELPDDIAEFIATKVKSNIRQLEGVVKKINIMCLIDKEKPSVNIAQNAIKDILSDNEPMENKIEKIIQEVARAFNVQPQDIYSKKRTANLSLARQVAMYCVREVTNLAYDAIGKQFSGRDHTTVIYAVQQITDKIKVQSDLKSTIDDIIKNVNS
ncbi:MAG: chromosomal replication initiator protein DnaA [Ruminococcaceae bacterium]|nr:chromosomal replication initiator protein DnaA [Oscillospiraceae bacterium]